MLAATRPFPIIPSPTAGVKGPVVGIGRHSPLSIESLSERE